MRKGGNAASNKLYNPQNKRPPVPIDADEADSAMERFVRAKYVQAAVNGNAGTGGRPSHDSDDDTPPPLPPKTGRFGFKSPTSNFPLSFRSKKGSRDSPTSPHEFSDSNASSLRNKPSKVFGASVHQESPEVTAQKLTQLREMGFTDDKRNAMVLKGVNGNLDRTVEALVRLGEGGKASSPMIPSRDSSLPSSRSFTPQPTTQTPLGLSKSSPPPAGQSPSTPSNNPWDIPPPPQPQSSQSTGTLQNKNPFYSTTNPFGMPTQQAELTLNTSLQSLSLSPNGYQQQQQQQPLFPHHTGGLPAPQPMSQPLYQQSMTPPIPQTQSFGSVVYSGGNNTQSYLQTVHQSPLQTHNPFLQAPSTQQSLLLNTTPQPGQGTFGGNPFLRTPTRIASPLLNQIPEQSQQNVYNTPQSPYVPQSTQGSNPFLIQQAAGQMPQPAQQGYYPSQQPQQVAYQQPYQAQQPSLQPQRQDKAAILALYGTAPIVPIQAQQQDQSSLHNGINQPAAQLASQPMEPQRSVSLPLPGNKNPFVSSTPMPTVAPATLAAVNKPAFSDARSRESMTLGMEMAWNNGRHSPDAFASLSARST
jgi:hypothetical protein